jgi:CysZ protein
LGGLLYAGALYLGWQGIEQAMANLPNWAVPLEILLQVLLVILLLLATGFLFLQFGVLLGSPWYGKLSEEIEALRTGRMVLVEINPLSEISRAIQYELKKMVLWVSVGLLLLLANFLPGLGTIVATVGGLALAATITCMDFLDPALERRRLRFRQKLGMVRRGLPASFTFGLVCFGLASIPFLNLLAIPICVAGGTLFFCDHLRTE